ncbi:hypothetical protein C2S51_027186 [Perilla frutescens var. frutescens]|nr:hypothetical protein C2S51_027186 [Perilla frutescens var. frutescens]
MHRSSSHSAARSSDEFLVNFSSSSALKGFDSSQDLLADYDDKAVVSDDISKNKDVPVKSTFGERAVHLIPLVLIFCGLVLWWFSNPVQLH